jgi:hypothetical protein
MRLPGIITGHLQKARAAAIAAVEVYNRPGTHFRTPQYVVLITIAWTALFHAVFHRRGVKPWYVKSGTGRGVRYEKTEGEPKHWELSECLRRYHGDHNTPERANLRFLIGLRNKIEHRHLPNLDPALYGECQAALLNFEEVLTREFGDGCALGESLAVSLQFSRVTPQARAAALRELSKSSAQSVRDYIDQFRAGLDNELLNDPAFSFRVFLVPKTANRQNSADMAVEFVPYDPQNLEQTREMERLTTLIRERQIRVAGQGLMKPGRVVERVRVQISEMNLYLHTCCWRHFNVRPSKGSDTPHGTDDRYCLYDEPHDDYLYTDAWVEKLTRELRDPEKYRSITQRRAP